MGLGPVNRFRGEMRTQPMDNEHKRNKTNRLQPHSSNRFWSQNLISTQLEEGSNCYPVAKTSDCVRQLPQNSVVLNYFFETHDRLPREERLSEQEGKYFVLSPQCCSCCNHRAGSVLLGFCPRQGSAASAHGREKKSSVS